MENSSITIKAELKSGFIKIDGPALGCQWKTYQTDKANIIFLRAFLKNGVREITYDGSTEEFGHALGRIILDSY